MRNDSDIAKLRFALDNNLNIIPGGRAKGYSTIENGKQKTANTVLYEKEIGDKSYYVVQAVPDTNAKCVFIVTTFIGKKGYKKEASQLKDAKGPNVTADTASEITSINIITDSSKKAIPKIKQISPAC